jgi:uncharacterized protein (TIGR02284 family)
VLPIQHIRIKLPRYQFFGTEVELLGVNLSNTNMETTAEMTTTILNDLVQINNDRINGYERAIKELHDEDSDLKSLFVKMIGESHQYKLALATEISAMGDDVDKGTTASGKIYRAWMDVKAMFTGHDRKTVLSNCEFGEDAAQKAYKMALEDESMPAHIRSLITEQKQKLRESHDQIKALRDAQV